MSEKPKPTGSRVAVLGGGQLGRMMGLAGLPLGLEFTFLDPAADACAASVGGLVQAGFDDIDAVRRLAANTDAATFDFENVPKRSAEAFERMKPFYPQPAALAACQDRLAEKQLLNLLGIAAPGYHPVSSRTDLLDGIEALGFPAVLKTRRLGYDGKGQAVLSDQEDLERAWQRLGDFELILESFVAFEAEYSLIAVRGLDGETHTWPLTRNLHSNGILMLSLADGGSRKLQAGAADIMNRVLDHFGYVGVLTLEFFVQDGELLVNEIAPRVHNSGHWTIDGAGTSQFENHLRAIMGWPLGMTDPKGCALMFNWIGSLPERSRALTINGLHWHDYGKQPRPGRKVGHATLTADSISELKDHAERLAAIAGGNFPALLNALFC